MIGFILSGNYRGKGLWLFYSNRALRIYVPYLVVWTSTLVLSIVILAHKGYTFGNFNALLVNAKNFDLVTWIYVSITSIAILGQDVGLYLGYENGALYFTKQFWTSAVQVPNFQLLPQSWSMSLELMFYLLAPFLVFRSTFTLVAIVLFSLAVRVIAFHHGLHADPWLYRFFPAELALFVGGLLAHRIYAHRAVSRVICTTPLVVHGGTLLAIALVLGFAPPINFYARYFVSSTSWGGYPWGAYLCLALSLPFLFQFSRRYAWDRALGDLSYPVYLIHWPILALMPFLLPSQYLAQWQGLTVAVITVVLSALFASYVEKPLEKIREQRARNPSAAAAHLGDAAFEDARS